MFVADGAVFGLEQIEFRIAGLAGSESRPLAKALRWRIVAHQPGYPGGDEPGRQVLTLSSTKSMSALAAAWLRSSGIC